jgi:hypothetical protein
MRTQSGKQCDRSQTQRARWPLPRRQCALAVATALAGGVLLHQPAQAQDAASLKAIQSEISSLQAQLKRLQRQAADRDAALKSAQADAAQARAESAQAISRTASYGAAVHGVPLTSPPGYYPQGPSTSGGFTLGSNATNPNATSLQGASPSSITTTSVDANNPTFRLGGITITLGGFLDATAFYRSKDLTSGSSTSFNGIPYGNSVNAHIPEFRMSAQNSRFSMLVAGSPGPGQTIGGYFEGDLQGAATSSNSNQSNSYTPRMRLAYSQYDDKPDGWHLLAGQDWSMAVGDTVGITPRKELLPPTIDNNYTVGFVYTRAPQLRIVKDFGGTLWLGASIEAPQETYSSAGSLSESGGVLPNGQTLIYNSSGTGFLNSTTTYSYDVAPDMILKAAVDTGFGHYEAYGLGRFFRTRTSIVGGGDNRTMFGGGVGGSASIPILPKYVDLIGNVLVGDGVGRYGAGQLPDATFDSQGNPVPLRAAMGMAGVVAHPVKAIDMYALVGTQQTSRSTFQASIKGVETGYGYGTSLANDADCGIELDSCSAQTRALDEITAGGWWRFMHGGYGTVQAGVQYSYVKKIAFSAKGGKPDTDDNLLFFTLRYLPFQ